MITHVMEDYLKTLYHLELGARSAGAGDEGQGAPRVPTGRLAEAMGVTQGSATGMVKNLAERRLVEHRPYEGVRLTDAGRAVALEVVRHHRLLELYLSEALDLGWDEVHEEADRMEHVISPELANRISQKLGHPRVDPHGDPIPGPGGELPEDVPDAHKRLPDLPEGTRVRVARVVDQDPEKLRFLGDHGLFVDAEVVLVENPPAAAGYVRLEVDGDTVVLGRDLAANLLVAPLEVVP